MTAFVVDASAAAAAFFQEEHALAAWRFLISGHDLLAPDLIVAELANVIWKRRRRKEIDQDEALGLLTDFQKLPLQITPSNALIDAALALALRTDCCVYDCLYLALAMQAKAVMVTNDLRLVNALEKGPLSQYIQGLDTLARSEG